MDYYLIIDSCKRIKLSNSKYLKSLFLLNLQDIDVWSILKNDLK